MAEEDNINSEVFIYTEGAVVPRDVVRVRVHPSVTIIPEHAFYNRRKLEEVELCDGLLEIGQYVFQFCSELKRLSIPSTVTVITRGTCQYCERLTEVELNDGLLEIGDGAFSMCSALKRVEIPSTVVRIGDRAFEYAPVSIQLPDRIENIDQRALANNKTITNFRIPPLIRCISSGVLADCESLFSLELPESIYMGMMPFSNCISLRNIALPYDVSILGRGIRGPFQFCDDLKELFDTDNQIINALQHRFDNLPIHKMIYYQSYNNVTPDQLNSALDMRSGQRRSARMKLASCFVMTSKSYSIQTIK